MIGTNNFQPSNQLEYESKRLWSIRIHDKCRYETMREDLTEQTIFLSWF